MASCEHLQRTSMYFDGALPASEEREAADHIATCEHCQAVLSDGVGLYAAVSDAAAVATARPHRAAAPGSRRRVAIAIAAVSLAAAAAVAIVVLRPTTPDTPPPERVALVLASKRSLEARFSGEQLGAHRPYEPAVDRAREPIDPRALADLERSGRTRDLVGALAAAGELVRAREAARGLPADAATQSDLAALALASGNAEAALDHAYQALSLDREHPAATWNLALAARQLRYLRVSRAAFARVAARAEPGWSVEAKGHLEALAREQARGDDIPKLRAQFQALVKAGSVRATITDPAMRQLENLAEFQRRSRSIVADQTPIELADVRRFPSHAWVFLYEALGAATPSIVEGLEPVAAALDKLSGTTAASAMAKRAVSKDIKAALGTRKTLAQIAALLQKPIDTAAQAELRRLAGGDPFVALFAVVDPGDVPARCTNDAFALPCAFLVQDLARRQLLDNRVDEALRTGELGRDIALRAIAPVDYATLAQIHRKAGRAALARADEEEAATP